jgi:acyl-CoA thioesterase I
MLRSTLWNTRRNIAKNGATQAALCAFVTACIAILFPLLFTSSSFADTPKATKRAEKVMIYGDSLSAAYGINPAQGWVTLLETRLKEQNRIQNTSQNIAVVNASISGETTKGGLARIETDLKRHHPTIVVIALGANDGLRGLPVADTRKNLVGMLEAIRKANARAVIIGIQIPPNYGIQYANDFKRLFGQLAQERKLPLVPFLLEGLAENLDNFQADRLHPTAAVQPRILDNVWPVLSAAIAKK